MAYLAKSDYTLRISVEHLDEILEQSIISSGLTETNVLNNAESWAQAMINSYLGIKYNMAAEFATTGAGRNFLIIQAMIDLSLCTLHKTINPRDVPEHIANACDSVIKWLIDARDGVVGTGLTPATPVDGVPHNRTFIESQPKFISKPYQDLSIFS
jgi:phage gp36-like protein